MSAPIRWSQKPGSTSVRGFILPTSVADLASFPLDIPPAAVDPTDTAPPPAPGPDGTPESGFRDRDIRHAIKAALLATGFFDQVVLANTEDDYSLPYAVEARLAMIDLYKQDVKAMWDTDDLENVVVDSHIKLSFIAQSDSPQRRDELIEQMMNAAYNAMVGVSWLGQTMPAFSAFGPYVKSPKALPPVREVDRIYTYRYMPGTAFGTAD